MKKKTFDKHPFFQTIMISCSEQRLYSCPESWPEGARSSAHAPLYISGAVSWHWRASRRTPHLTALTPPVLRCEVVWSNQVSSQHTLSSHQKWGGGGMRNNKLTFSELEIKLTSSCTGIPTNINDYNLFFFFAYFGSHHPEQTRSNPDCTPSGGQRVYKKGLATGNTVASNRLWCPAATLTGLLSEQQQYPKWTADQQGKWITTWAIFSILYSRGVASDSLRSTIAHRTKHYRMNLLRCWPPPVLRWIRRHLKLWILILMNFMSWVPGGKRGAWWAPARRLGACFFSGGGLFALCHLVLFCLLVTHTVPKHLQV